MKKVIAITGPIGAGKSEVATIVLRYFGEQSMLLPLAYPIKEIARSIGWNGEKDNKGRRLLQAIGTAGRDYRQDIWLKIWSHLAMSQHTPEYLIVDDLRYENELRYFREGVDNLILYVYNSQAERKRSKHKSEQLTLDKVSGKGVVTIRNMGSLTQLSLAVTDLLTERYPKKIEEKEAEDVQATANDGN